MKLYRFIILALCLTFSLQAFAEAPDLDKALKETTERLAAKIEAKGKTKVTVLDFTDLNYAPVGELGKYIAGQLNLNFVMENRKFSMLDRANLNRILAEHKLTAKGLVDPDNAKKLGQFAGVDTIITGIIVHKGKNIELAITASSTDSSEYVGADKCEFKNDEFVQQLETKPAVEDALMKATGSGKKSAANLTKKFETIEVAIDSLQVIEPGFYSLSFNIKNTAPKRSVWVALEHISPNSFPPNNTLTGAITDPGGNEYKCPSYPEWLSGINGSLFDANTRAFMNATEINANDSIVATAKFRSEESRPATPGSCAVTFNLLYGTQVPYGSTECKSGTKRTISVKIDAE